LPQGSPAVGKEYDPATLSGEAILRGVSFFEMNNDAEGTLAWGKAWLEKKEESRAAMVADSVLEERTTALARLAEGRKQYAQAAEFYRLGSAKPVRMETRLKMMWLGVAELCDNMGEADRGLAEARSWENKIDGNQGAQALLLQGAVAYAAIAKGDEEAAKGAVALAQKAVAGTGGSFGSGGAAGKFNDMQIRQGVLARNVENYIRTKDFDTAWKLINQWDMEMPAAAWEGFTRTLRVKLAAAEGRPLAAAQMALAHAKANPGGFYAAELLLRASENFEAAGKREEARTVLEMLRTKYPESPYARGEK